VKLRPAQLAGLAIAFAMVIAGKHYYRNAGAEELAWLLGPTARMVSALTGSHFVHEAGVGWVDRNVTFEIAPVCAGLNFMLAGFLALSIGWLGGMRTWRGMAKRIAVAAVVAYAATLLVNTIRIAIAIRMHVANASSSDLHRLEGIIVYLGGLCALYAAAKHIDERVNHEAT
jgi:exosortase K